RRRRRRGMAFPAQPAAGRAGPGPPKPKHKLFALGFLPAPDAGAMLEVSLTVSVIIKTLNEEKKIAATIESALAAVEATGGEVIVADSGSRDRTVEIAARYGVVVAQIEPPAQPSCGIGPQLGYQYSRHPFLCLLDGDMILDP